MQSKRFDYTCLGLVSFAGITCLHNGIKNKDLTMIITGATIEVIATGIGAMYYYEDKIYIPDSFNIQPSYKKYKTVVDWGLSLVLITGAISIIPISGWMIYDSCS